MIEYHPGNWGFAFAWSLKGSVFPKSFCVAGPCAALCAALHHVLRVTTEFEENQILSSVGGSVLAGFTGILGFLIVFRSQTAYSRWWEGGTLLQQIRGEWFNAYSSLLAFSNPSPDREQEVNAFQHKLIRLFSLLYASALEQVTTIDGAVFEIIELEGLEVESLAALKTAHDKCEVVLQWIQKLIVQSSGAETVKIAPPILSRVYNQLGNGIVGLNNARKITDFPIPFPLAQMVVFMLVCHWVMTLVTCVIYVKSVWTAALINFLVVFSFWTINFISLELEMPFGDDANDLPLYDMQRDFNKSLAELLKPEFMNPPNYKMGAHVSLLKTTDTQVEKHIDDLLRSDLEGILRMNIAAEPRPLAVVLSIAEVGKGPNDFVVAPVAEPPKASELTKGFLREPSIHLAGPVEMEQRWKKLNAEAEQRYAQEKVEAQASPGRQGHPPAVETPDRQMSSNWTDHQPQRATDRTAAGGVQPQTRPDPSQTGHQAEEPFIGWHLGVGVGSPDFEQPREVVPL